MALNNKSPNIAYLTGTALYPGTQAQADAAETAAKTELGTYLSYGQGARTAVTVSGGEIVIAPA